MDGITIAQEVLAYLANEGVEGCMTVSAGQEAVIMAGTRPRMAASV